MHFWNFSPLVNAHENEKLGGVYIYKAIKIRKYSSCVTFCAGPQQIPTATGATTEDNWRY